MQAWKYGLGFPIRAAKRHPTRMPPLCAGSDNNMVKIIVNGAFIKEEKAMYQEES